MMKRVSVGFEGRTRRPNQSFLFQDLWKRLAQFAEKHSVFSINFRAGHEKWWVWRQLLLPFWLQRAFFPFNRCSRASSASSSPIVAGPACQHLCCFACPHSPSSSQQATTTSSSKFGVTVFFFLCFLAPSPTPPHPLIPTLI